MMETDHCRDVQVCFVGANRFQHDLLVYALREVRGCQCDHVVLESLSGLSGDFLADQNSSQVLFLDCFGLSPCEMECLLQQVRAKVCSSIPIALINLHRYSGYERTGLNYGVRGFFYAHDTVEDICRGTRTLIQGEIWASRKVISEQLLAESQDPPWQSVINIWSGGKLSGRELEILRVLATGASNRAIGEALFISPHTVRTHLYNIYKKIGVSSRFEAVVWASKNLPAT